jgi:cbb3-type cytochrome oxidase subunit 3
MNPHLPPDEALAAALVLVLIFFVAIWWVEYWK